MSVPSSPDLVLTRSFHQHDTGYIVIKQWLPEDEQEMLFEHTRLRHERAQLMITSGLNKENERVDQESRPRLTKEQIDILEATFKQNPEPSTIMKKDIAQNYGLTLEKVNVRFCH